MVRLSPLSVSVFPTASGDEANLRFHNASLIMATGAPPIWSSDSVKTRPATGFTPRIEKNAAEIMLPLSRSALPCPVRLKSSCRKAANAVKV